MHQDGRDEERHFLLSCRRRPDCLPRFSPGAAHAARNYNLNVSMDNAERCSDLRVRSTNGEVAQAAETRDTGRARCFDARSSRTIAGSGRPSGCAPGTGRSTRSRPARSRSRTAARRPKRCSAGITVSRSGGRLTTSGPSNDSGSWQVYFLVHAPKNAQHRPADEERSDRRGRAWRGM